ncbi:gamma-tubulin complex component 3 [Phlebotomus argentipes]|uniref:gamma-tubulin complex component 3 n=1 Tax=Phlebotomus argentipes TaxID=94469 RepID=UPI002892BA31|nr:gamma-tubulin complex component 3 [Phlebotomus argentipes]
MNNNNNQNVYDLVEQLCTELGGRNHRGAARSVTAYLANTQNAARATGAEDEQTIVAKIRSILSQKSSRDLESFARLHNHLSSSMELVPRTQILSFLLCMANSGRENRGQSAGRNNSVQRAIPESALPRPTMLRSQSASKAFSSRSSSALQATTSVPRSGSQSSFDVVDLQDELVQDVLYAMIGKQCKYLRKDVVNGGFKLEPAKRRSLSAQHAEMLLRLAEVGFLHDQVENFVDKRSEKHPLGLIGQGLVTAIRRELTEHYGTVASMQEHVNATRRESNGHQRERVTLMKLMMWVMTPQHRLSCLMKMLEKCVDRKGGTLISAIHSFLSHGDRQMKSFADVLLQAMCLPLRHMLLQWLLNGEVEDPYGEFFIETLHDVSNDRLWHEKYRVRESQLPTFISTNLANKILVIGKGINFLRQVCHDEGAIGGREDLKLCFEESIESLFSASGDTRLHQQIDNFYLSTSKKVLQVITGPHKLLDHLKAMRDYLLMGQGDFIGLLMESLKCQLDSPAKEVHCYNLSAIMDATIRMTNAQFDDPDILNHLEVQILEPFDGDTGWDIFYLKYTVQGPVATMLEPCMAKYKMIFKPLWRTKRIEFVVMYKVWKEQMCNAKQFRSMRTEMNSITYKLHLCTLEMMHFISEIQYYILFEVIECSWAALSKRIGTATDIDDILEAHSDFLETIRYGIFLDAKSENLLAKLDTIFHEMMNLEAWQDKFYEVCFRELNARTAFDKHVMVSEKKGQYGVTTEKRLERDQEKKFFQIDLAKFHKSLDHIRQNYETSVKQFLYELASSNDYNLQLFGIRLDFNEYYKRRDERLNVPLTYEFMRLSNMFSSSRMNASSSSRMSTSHHN